jgi:hypothetical protein
MRFLSLQSHGRPSPRTNELHRARPSLELLEDRCLLSGVPFVIGGDPRVDPNDYRMTTFATGLNFPYAMIELSDGSLLAAVSKPAAGSFYNSTGQLLRLVDANQDGIADGPGTILYTGLPGSLTALRQSGNLIFVTSSQAGSEQIDFLRAGATPASPLTFLGSINFSFTANWEHTTFELAVRPSVSSPGDTDLFFNVGSPANQTSTTTPVPISGLITGGVLDSSIYMVTVHDTGGTPTVSNLTQIATGLRNAAGMAFSQSGTFWFQDNGIDGGGNPEEELSADEMNRLTASQIGGPVENFGFPSTYTDYFTGKQVGNTGIPPTVAFLPSADGGVEIAGATKVTFAPPQFPRGLNYGMFVGFHGIFDGGGSANDENPVAFVDPHTDTFFPFIAASQAGVGHLDGLMATQDSLFLADISTNGDIFNTAQGGAIYQIKALSNTLTGTPWTIHPNEGQPFNSTVATFTETNLQLGTGDYSAMIDWGDGTPTTAGTIVATTTPGKFLVTGSHIYAEEAGAKSLPMKVTIIHDTLAAAVIQSQADVLDSPLVGGTIVSFRPVAGTTYTGGVARFTDRDAGALASDYTATITWGDGHMSAGTFTLISGTTFRVSGSNLYASPGTYTVTVMVQDAGGAMTTIQGSVTVGAGAIASFERPLVIFGNWPQPSANGTFRATGQTASEAAQADERARELALASYQRVTVPAAVVTHRLQRELSAPNPVFDSHSGGEGWAE